MVTPVEVFLGILAAVLVIVFTTVAFVLITQYGKPNKREHISPPLPEAQMPVWHTGDHFVDHLPHKSVSEEIDHQVKMNTGDQELDDLLRYKRSNKSYDPLEKTDHALHGMISHDNKDEQDLASIDEDYPLRR